MKMNIEKTNAIDSIETWFRYAEPEGGLKQWKDGRSAKEFARYMLSNGGNMPEGIEKCINELFGTKSGDCLCLPEYVTKFPLELGKGEGRHHDAILVSNKEGKEWLIGVEAKVSEPFDKTMNEWLEEGKKKNKDGGKNRKVRLEECLKLITGKDYCDKDLEESPIKDLRYQLISATAGTIIEAGDRNIKKACLLVVVFGGDVEMEKDYKKNVEENQKDYDEYLKFLGLEGKPEAERKIKVTYKDIPIDLYFRKIEVNIKKGSWEVVEPRREASVSL